MCIRDSIYITHRLAEIAQLADRCIGLRDGRNSGELARAEIDTDRMVQLMVGRDLAGAQRQAHVPGVAMLRVTGLRTSEYPTCAVDLEVRAGEVVGISGLLGAGRSELLRAIFGIDRRLAGEVTVGEDSVDQGLGSQTSLPIGDPREAIARGLALLPEDRKHEGLILSMSVRENASLPTLHRQGVWLDRGYERRCAEQAIADLGISCSSQEQVVGLLSGGNQQKVVLGKWLAAEPRVLLLDEPTNDLDVDTLRALEEALLGFPGSAIVVSHDRWFLDRIATHILAFEGNSEVVWFEGNYDAYAEDLKRRKGADADRPHRIKFKPLAR